MDFDTLLDDIPRFLDEIKNHNLQKKEITIDYVLRLKKCYQKINEIINKTKNEKFIVEGYDSFGNKEKCISDSTIKTNFLKNFDLLYDGIIYYNDDVQYGKNKTYSKKYCKLNYQYYYYHSLLNSEILENKLPILIKRTIDTHSQYQYQPTNINENNINKIFIPSYNIKTILLPSVTKWLIDNAKIINKTTVCESFAYAEFKINKSISKIELFNNEIQIDFNEGSNTKIGRIISSGYHPMEHDRENSSYDFSHKKFIYLSYLLDKHETIRPHPEFIKRSEHQFIASNILLKRLYKLTKNYYILGEMKNSKLESIEKTLEEITN